MEAKDYAAMATAFLALIGLGFGLYQYYVAQKWRRSEFAAKQLEQLVTDPELSLLCKLLDWKRRDLPVPKKYRALTDATTFEHNWTILAEAMIEGRREGRYTWQQAMYRDLLDHFCEYLQTLNHYLSIGLIDLRDTATLKYWLKELKHPRFAAPGDERMFMEFIRVFGYTGVTRLMDRFGMGQPGTEGLSRPMVPVPGGDSTRSLS